VGRARKRRGRRGALACAAALASLALGAARAASAAAPAPFGFVQVVERARELAAQPFRDPTGKIPDWLLRLGYDQWREIRFRPERALWSEGRLPFQVQFFHPGFLYDRPVAVHVVDAQGVHDVAFSPSRFDYGSNDFASSVPQDLGHAGLRVHFPLKTPTYHDEVIVFLGASYFRAVGRRQGFGLSARGLAVDTALPRGEEFPWFSEFWLVRPAAGASELAIYALLESPGLTGAYRFVVHPGEQTVVEVTCQIFRRWKISKLGIAPLTSMFFVGENTLREIHDFRPEVHDSDGLLVASATGEWIWRPLDNPTSLQVSGFALRDPRGFGLIQRDREFEHYQDLETRMELRPSAWVVPKEGWGEGRVELVEIPTRSDVNDNIVAYWVPEEVPPPGEPLSFSYSIHWYGSDTRRPPGGRALATRRDYGMVENAQRFVVDFTGGGLEKLPAETVLRGVISLGPGSGEEGELLDQQVFKNPVTGGWRLVFQIRPYGSDPIELRAFLQQGERALTETWSYGLRP
jgi:glucans biosynthesis protein